jgi:hypothetical protein
MAKLSAHDQEVKVVSGAIEYWKGFLDALESLKKIPNIEKQIQLAKDTMEDYKERLNDLRRKAKRNNTNARRNKRT